MFPEEDDRSIKELLFLLVTWHAYAKLRLHTDTTLEMMKVVVTDLCQALRNFTTEICPRYTTRELPKEARARVSRQQECYDSFPFALLHADTLDCLLSPLPHPLIGLLYFYDLIWLMRSHLAASCLVRYSSDVAIRSLVYDTYLRATHTPTSSIRGVQIPIYLVSDATDSLQRSVAVFKMYQ